ncbi:MAG: hypothetical protein IJO40_05135 [Thermoguttaceae bacterium]|nr:hypothetical protein [Thermoguttaceae bacterium]
MKTREKTNKQKYIQTFVDITFTFDMKLSVGGDADDWDVKHQVEEIFNDLIAMGEIVVVDGDTAAIRGQITDVEVETDGEITEEEFNAAPGKPDLLLGSHFKLN